LFGCFVCFWSNRVGFILTRLSNCYCTVALGC